MSKLIQALFFIGDLLFLNLCIYLSTVWIADASPIRSADGLYLVVFSTITWFFLVMVASPYNVTKGWGIMKIVKSQSAFIFIHLMVVTALTIFFKRHYPWLQITVIYSVFLAAFFVSRIVTFYIRALLTNRLEQRNFIVVGDRDQAREIRKYFLVNRAEGRRFYGHFEKDVVLNSFSTIEKHCVEHNVHEIYCCVGQGDRQELEQLIEFGLDSLIMVRMVMTASTPDSRLLQLDRFDNLPGTDLAVVAIDEWRNRAIKRAFDLVVSITFALLVLSWLIPLIGLIIKLDSRGPVFFIQKRNGRGNKPFGCIKFRSMVQNQEADTKQATRGDARITKVGAFLRKSSLDELPQLLNVIKGDMSLIGPRPHPISLNEKFAVYITKLMSRHYVKPGLTGLAQCMGYRGETKDVIDMENRYRLDRFYIENWSFWLDIKIIFLTVVSLIRGSDKAF